MKPTPMKPTSMPPTPGLRIGRLRLVTDQPLSADRAEALGTRFASALDLAMASDGRRRDLRVGELVLRAPHADLGDAAAIERLAASVARRILERSRD